jgi:hypothetical protein
MAVKDQIGRDIELKALHHYPRMSEDSECFDAAIYIDGKKVGTARDDGNGGMIHIQPHSLHEQLNEIGKSVGKLESEFSPEGLQIDAELIVGALLMEALHKKDFKKYVKPRKVTFADGAHIYTFGDLPIDKSEQEKLFEYIKKENPNAVFFNGLSEEKAFELYCTTNQIEIGWKLMKKQDA